MGRLKQAYAEIYGFEAVETPFVEYTEALGDFPPDQDQPNKSVFSFQEDGEQWAVAERIGDTSEGGHAIHREAPLNEAVLWFMGRHRGRPSATFDRYPAAQAHSERVASTLLVVMKGSSESLNFDPADGSCVCS